MSSSIDNSERWYRKPGWWQVILGIPVVILAIPVVILAICGIASMFIDWEIHTILINDPQEDKEVSYHYIVSGASNVNPNSKLNIYVLVKPIDVPQPWYNQPSVTIQSNGDWEADAYFGESLEDSGNYKVCAIITKQELFPGQTFDKIPKNSGMSKIIIVKHISASRM